MRRVRSIRWAQAWKRESSLLRIWLGMICLRSCKIKRDMIVTISRPAKSFSTDAAAKSLHRSRLNCQKRLLLSTPRTRQRWIIRVKTRLLMLTTTIIWRQRCDTIGFSLISNTASKTLHKIESVPSKCAREKTFSWGKKSRWLIAHKTSANFKSETLLQRTREQIALQHPTINRLREPHSSSSGIRLGSGKSPRHSR